MCLGHEATNGAHTHTYTHTHTNKSRQRRTQAVCVCVCVCVCVLNPKPLCVYVFVYPGTQHTMHGTWQETPRSLPLPRSLSPAHSLALFFSGLRHLNGPENLRRVGHRQPARLLGPVLVSPHQMLDGRVH